LLLASSKQPRLLPGVLAMGGAPLSGGGCLTSSLLASGEGEY